MMPVVNQVIAGVEPAVGLHHQVAAAASGMDAGGAGMAKILPPRLLNIHHKNPPDIVALTPLAPDSDHKAPPVIGAEPVALRQGIAFAHQRLKLQVAGAKTDNMVVNGGRVPGHLVVDHHQ